MPRRSIHRLKTKKDHATQTPKSSKAE